MRAIVIGAGPAGGLAALLLARRGVAVTLLEQHGFPRDKVCGECLSALGRQVLRRHRLEAPIAAIGVELTRARLVGRDREARIDLPHPMLGITRARLDASLLAEAVSAGAELLQPARAESIEGTTVRVRRMPDNRVQTLSADVVIVADGRGTAIGNRPPLTGDLGIKAHFADVALARDTITLFSGEGSYGGIAPVEGGRWNVAFSVPAERVRKAGGDVAGVFRQLEAAHPGLEEALRGSRLLGNWLASPLPRYTVRNNWPAGVVPIGNAACAIEPIGGEGMGAALRSAELAINAILDGQMDRLDQQFRDLWHTRARFCRAGAVAFSSRRWADACVGLAESGSLARLGLGLIGK